MAKGEVTVEAIWSDDDCTEDNLANTETRCGGLYEGLHAKTHRPNDGGPFYLSIIKVEPDSTKVVPAIKAKWGNRFQGPLRLWIADIEFDGKPDGLRHLRKVFRSSEGDDILTDMVIVLSGYREYEERIKKILPARIVWKDVKTESTVTEIVDAIGLLIVRHQELGV